MNTNYSKRKLPKWVKIVSEILFLTLILGILSSMFFNFSGSRKGSHSSIDQELIKPEDNKPNPEDNNKPNPEDNNKPNPEDNNNPPKDEESTKLPSNVFYFNNFNGQSYYNQAGYKSSGGIITSLNGAPKCTAEIVDDEFHLKFNYAETDVNLGNGVAHFNFGVDVNSDEPYYSIEQGDILTFSAYYRIEEVYEDIIIYTLAYDPETNSLTTMEAGLKLRLNENGGINFYDTKDNFLDYTDENCFDLAIEYNTSSCEQRFIINGIPMLTTSLKSFESFPEFNISLVRTQIKDQVFKSSGYICVDYVRIYKNEWQPF